MTMWKSLCDCCRRFFCHCYSDSSDGQSSHSTNPEKSSTLPQTIFPENIIKPYHLPPYLPPSTPPPPLPLHEQTQTTGESIPNLTDLIVIEKGLHLNTSYSVVYRGSYKENSLGSKTIQVAVKIVKGLGSSKDVERRFRRESETWWRLSHQTILQLLGYAAWDEPFEQLALISPWCEYGTADDYLHNHYDMSVSLRLWREVSEGVDFLHRQDPVIIHGDLKPLNVLVDTHGIAKLCDFGLVRILYTNQCDATDLNTTSSYGGTLRYKAPELWKEGAQPTVAGDIYALGCIGLYFIYRINPYANVAQEEIILEIKRDVPPAQRQNDVANELALEYLWNSFDLCWSRLVEDRPSSWEIAGFLRHYQEEIYQSFLRLEANPVPHIYCSYPALRVPIGYSLDTSQDKQDLPLLTVVDSVTDPGTSAHMKNLAPRIVNVSIKPARKTGTSFLYTAELDSTQVVIKVMRLPNPNLRTYEDYMQLWGRLHHENIVQFMGYFEGELVPGFDLPSPAMVYRWFSNGNIREYIQRRNQAIAWHNRLKLVANVAEGLKYLCAYSPPIVHGNLKPENILIDDDCTAKLVDFEVFGLGISSNWQGEARPLEMATRRYCAPEDDPRSTIRSTEGDIFSLAAVSLEVLFNRLPYDSVPDERIVHLQVTGVKPADRPTRQLSVQETRIWILLESCWDKPSKRPSASHFLDILQRQDSATPSEAPPDEETINAVALDDSKPVIGTPPGKIAPSSQRLTSPDNPFGPNLPDPDSSFTDPLLDTSALQYSYPLTHGNYGRRDSVNSSDIAVSPNSSYELHPHTWNDWNEDGDPMEGIPPLENAASFL